MFRLQPSPSSLSLGQGASHLGTVLGRAASHRPWNARHAGIQRCSSRQEVRRSRGWLSSLVTAGPPGDRGRHHLALVTLTMFGRWHNLGGFAADRRRPRDCKPGLGSGQAAGSRELPGCLSGHTDCRRGLCSWSRPFKELRTPAVAQVLPKPPRAISELCSNAVSKCATAGRISASKETEPSTAPQSTRIK